MTLEGRKELKSVIDYTQKTGNVVSIELDGQQLGGIWGLKKDSKNVYIQFALLKEVFPFRTMEFEVERSQFISFLSLSKRVFNNLSSVVKIVEFIDSELNINGRNNILYNFSGYDKKEGSWATTTIKDWLIFEGTVIVQVSKSGFELRLQDDSGNFTCKPSD